jgi:hypothetical protein
MILGSSAVIEILTRRLKSKNGREVVRIASFWNSFEGWLKYELALALCEEGFRPWTSNEDDAGQGTIGVEYKAASRNGNSRMDIQTRKQIDLWVSTRTDMENSNKKWHAIELKVAFNNANAKKQVASWAEDFASLCRLRDRNIESRLAVLVAVGFEKDSIEDVVGGDASVTWLAKKVDRSEDSTPSVALAWLS